MCFFKNLISFQDFVLDPTLTPLSKVKTIKDLAKSLSVSKETLNFLGKFGQLSCFKKTCIFTLLPLFSHFGFFKHEGYCFQI